MKMPLSRGISMLLKVRYERGAELGICHNRRDVGLTLACNNQSVAGHDERLSSILLIV